MQTLSPSRINCMLSCNRHHFWRYEIGLVPVTESQPYRFGKAMHGALAAKAHGSDFDTALAVGIGETEKLEEIDIAILSALLNGYYTVYADDIIKEMFPEIEIKSPIKYSRDFMGVCILDGLGVLKDNRQMIKETKTTSESLDSGSDFWNTLKYNIQVNAYVDASRLTQWDIQTILYDVIRKPMLKQSQIPLLDEDGKKIVKDQVGNRVMLDNGKPRQAGDEKQGWKLETRQETVEEFAVRLRDDVLARPEFYFARREVPVLESDLQEYRGLRDAVARQIVEARRNQSRYELSEFAWPRCVGRWTCNQCDMNSWCLQGIHADADHIPSGMRLKNETRKEV